MSAIIVTTPEELKAIVNEAITEFLPKTQIIESLPDTITLNSPNCYEKIFSDNFYLNIFKY
jgi:hypothetical protein